MVALGHLRPLNSRFGRIPDASVWLIALLPHIATILVGHYVVRLNPAILLGLCARAGTSPPALAAVEKAANSKVPDSVRGVVRWRCYVKFDSISKRVVDGFREREPAC